jgi:hypothetical protein
MAIVNTAHTVAQADASRETTKPTLIVPKEIWDDIKRIGIDQDASAQQVAIDALREYVNRHKPIGARRRAS